MLLLLSAGLTGCVRYVETYSVSFRARNGTELAAGEIDLSSPLPATGEIRAWYKLEMRPVLAPDHDMQAFFQAFKGSSSGRVAWTLGAVSGRDPATMDFNPSTDMDVVATVYQRARGYWGGSWKYNNYTGSYQGGSISISRRATVSGSP
jgi:hypothetical protein